ncbi:amidohydrolase family protein [Dictyobacter kobayashii]|uniref:N-ethylammeline chlorohydrolase n=1 Tax=Dictyobacter kobayashii TaxID=2014872 RepID=A0A402AV74_9CHLR|nr:amidohydrolase family protein [Dictyobacter kobayashii]GCE23040.1 N-ethylammeline chlorohydrolase [Dictyobacter kobayashii]
MTLQSFGLGGRQQQQAILIENCRLLSQEDPSGLVSGDILVVGNIIEAIGKAGTLRAPDDVLCHTLTGENVLAVAGMINAHTHSPENILKAALPSMPVEIWGLALYNDYIAWTPQLTYLSALAGALEMLKTGTTAVLDHHWTVVGVSAEHLNAVMQAYHDCGIRATVAPFLEDRDLLLEAGERYGVSFPAHPYVDRFDNWVPLEEQFAVIEQFMQNWHGGAGGRLRGMPGPVGIQWCSPDLLHSCLEIAQKYQVGMHLHALETQFQANMVEKMLGKKGLQFLQDEGALKAGTSLAHAIWLEPGDLSLLAQTQTTVVHNPISNLRLGSGRFQLEEAIQQGVHVALGSDGSASNDTQNMFEVLKMTGLVHNQAHIPYKRWPRPAQIIEMATHAGALALGYQHELGRLAPGQLADIVLLDLLDSSFLPLHEPLLHLVYGKPDTAVDSVIVNGQLVLEHKKSTYIDESALYEEIRRTCQPAWPGIQAFINMTPATGEVIASFQKLYQFGGGH